MVRLSQSISPRPNNCCRLKVENLRFLVNGPYSFSLKEGECVGLNGRSGIGKTQLLRAVTDLIPYTGLLLLDGVSISSFSAPIWRSRVTMIPAEPLWWYNSVEDHFTTGLYTEPPKEELAAVGFAEDILQWQVSRLSTGEKQRLALVRGLCNRPLVLLLDEPCSSLDAYHTTLVETFVLDYLHSNRASLLWVSHDLEQLQRLSDRLLCMEKNTLIEKTV